MNKRLLREPDYNKKRRLGSGKEHLDTCMACQLPIPTLTMRDEGAAVPCSPYHVRCVRCCWPVERRHISPMGTCVMCMGASDRRRYYRRSDSQQRREIGEVEDSRETRDEDGDGDIRWRNDIADATREPQQGKFGTVTPSHTRDLATKQTQRRQRVLFKQFVKPRVDRKSQLATDEKVITPIGKKRRNATPDNPTDVEIRYRESPTVHAHENGMIMETP